MIKIEQNKWGEKKPTNVPNYIEPQEKKVKKNSLAKSMT